MSASRHSRTRVARATLIFFVTLMSACASQPKYASFRPIPEGTTVMLSSPDLVAVAPDAKDTGESAGSTAARGAGKGAAGGAAVGFQVGLACGPFAVICSPAFAIAGAGTGLVVGGIGGSIVGAAKGLPKEKAAAFEDIITKTIEDNEPRQQLRAAFKDASGQTWSFSDTDPEVYLSINLESLRLEQLQNDVVALHVQSVLIIRYGSTLEDRTRRFLFDESSERHPIDAWLENDGQLFKDELNRAYQGSVQRMVEVLTPIGS